MNENHELRAPSSSCRSERQIERLAPGGRGSFCEACLGLSHLPEPSPVSDNQGEEKLVRQRDGIHLYTLCWNDSRMLPHFFRHYSSLVDRFFVFDNGSTDGSLQLLAGNERVQVSHFQTEFDSFADTELRLSEEIWKNSKGLADWVLIVDIDEHVYHEDLRSYLRICRQRGITAIQAVGYEMISETFPDASMPLCDVVTNGVRSSEYCKLCLFDPSAITRTNFTYGRHSASPEGRVKSPAVPHKSFCCTTRNSGSNTRSRGARNSKRVCAPAISKGTWVTNTSSPLGKSRRGSGAWQRLRSRSRGPRESSGRRN